MTASQTVSYYHFEGMVWREFGGRIRRGDFDLVHRITPLSPTASSTIAERCNRAGVPFIVGPLNGAVPWPKEFRAEQHREGEFLSYVRSAYKLLPAYHATREFASAIIVGSRAVWDEMPEEYRAKCVYTPENAVDPRRFNKQASGNTDGPLRVCFVGRLVPYKGADMLIEAAAPLVHAGEVKLDIIGDGPEMKRLRELVAKLGIESGVDLPGWIEHEKLQDRLVRSEVFAFPSVREFGGGVVLEVMALGLVPVVLDYGGPSELVTDGTGYRVPMGCREDVILGFRRALDRLAEERPRIRQVGERARALVFSKFTWDAKAQQTLEIYRWVLGLADRPPLPFAS